MRRSQLYKKVSLVALRKESSTARWRIWRPFPVIAPITCSWPQCDSKSRI